MDLSLLIEKAHQLGIDDLKVTNPIPLTNISEILRKMQDNGLYPKFVTTNTEERVNPKKQLNNVKSIISVALAYKTIEPKITKPLSGLLSRYAWGIDYHIILYQQLENLAEFLVKEYNVNSYYIAVDTKPPVDRAIAHQAQLGWLGANCSIYVSPYGSWIFLGEIYIDKELPSSPTQMNIAKCPDKCHQCVQACPTNALYAPYKINPHICISYLTQMPGSIPRQWRKKIGKKLWGCDICQQVCPHNQQAKQSRHQEFFPLEDTSISLPPLLSISNRQFKERFGKTAIAWRGKKTLQRNATIILGNYQDPEAIPYLKNALTDPKPVIRESAVWSLKQIATPKAFNLIEKARLSETDNLVLNEMNDSRNF